MDLKFHRLAAIFRRNASTEVPATRLARVAHKDPHPTSQDPVRRKAAHLEPSTRPLYHSSAYHGRLEELPTFVSAYLDEAAAEHIADL